MRWCLATFLCLVSAGCSQKSSPLVTKKVSVQCEKMSFLSGLHSQFPSSFSLPLLQRFVQQNQLNEASGYINKTLENYPNCAALHIAQGFIWESRALLGESNAGKMATVAYQAALTADPSSPAAHYFLGQQLLSQGDALMAQRHFAQGVMMRPDEHKLLYALACASYRNGDIKTAHCSMKKALSLCSNNPLYYRTAAIIYAASGHFQESQVARDGYAKFASPSNAKDLNYVNHRIEYWKDLLSRKDLDRVNDAPKDVSKDTVEKDGEQPSVIFNGYILLVNQDTKTEKGNNILNAYSKVKRAADSLSLVLGGPTNKQNSSKPLFWWGHLKQSVTNAVGSDINSQTFNYSITPAALNYALNIANASQSIATYSSRPTISTLINKPASFFSGSIIKSAPSGGSIANINAGDVLEVKPISIGEDGLITLDVTMTSAEPVGEGGSRVLSPFSTSSSLDSQLVQVNSSRISTIVKVYPGQTIILGGLKTTVKRESDNRFPILGNIPILQYLFSSVNSNMTEATILYLISVQLGGQAKAAYTKKQDQNEVFKELNRVDPKGFSYSGPSNYALIFNTLNTMSLVSRCQPGDVLTIPDSQLEPLSQRLKTISSFFYF